MIYSKELELSATTLKALIGIIHLPSYFNVLSVVPDIITNDDEYGIIRLIIDELQNKDANI